MSTKKGVPGLKCSARGIFFPPLATEFFPSPELDVRYHVDISLATKPALGKGIKAKEKPLGTDTLCSEEEEEEDDPVAADLPAPHSAQLGSSEAN